MADGPGYKWIMPKSKGRKKPRKQKVATAKGQKRYQGQTLKKPPRSIWQIVRDHPIFWTLGTAAAVFGVVGALYDVLRPPAFFADPSYGDESYALPFQIRNESPLFDLHQARFRCWWNYLMFQGLQGQTFRIAISGGPGVSEFQPSEPADIVPNGSVNLGCDVTKYANMTYRPNPTAPMTRVPMGSVTLHIEAKYQTRFLFWFIPRTSTSEQFEWQRTADGFRWLSGPLLTYKN